MLVLVPGIRKIFNVPDGASLLAAIIVLAIMILPSIIKMSIIRSFRKLLRTAVV